MPLTEVGHDILGNRAGGPHEKAHTALLSSVIADQKSITQKRDETTLLARRRPRLFAAQQREHCCPTTLSTTRGARHLFQRTARLIDRSIDRSVVRNVADMTVNRSVRERGISERVKCQRGNPFLSSPFVLYLADKRLINTSREIFSEINISHAIPISCYTIIRTILDI